MDISIFAVLAVVALIILAAGAKKKKKPKPVAGQDWRIGPIIRGANYSPGMPSRPTMQGAGWYFDFPTIPTSHVHYLQWFNPPSLVGKREIVIRFTVTGGGFVPKEFPDGRPATVSLMIQRKGDDWSAIGKYQSYRWFSSGALNLAAGEFELVAPLDANAWGDVYNAKNAQTFAESLREVDNIAVLFGSNGGRGHGVYASEPSRFTLTSIEVRP